MSKTDHRSASSKELSPEPISPNALTREERLWLAALRRPGKRTVRAVTSGAGVRELAVEEVHDLDSVGGMTGALGVLRRLLAESPFQDVTLALRDGRLVSLRRTVRSRFSP